MYIYVMFFSAYGTCSHNAFSVTICYIDNEIKTKLINIVCYFIPLKSVCLCRSVKDKQLRGRRTRTLASSPIQNEVFLEFPPFGLNIQRIALTLETKIAEFANNVDLDEVAKEPPHQDLHCFPSSLWILSMISLGLNTFWKFSDENFVVCFLVVES